MAHHKTSKVASSVYLCLSPYVVVRVMSQVDTRRHM